MNKTKLFIVGVTFGLLSFYNGEKNVVDANRQHYKETSTIVVSVASLVFLGLAFACNKKD